MSTHRHYSTGAPCDCTFTAHLSHQAKTAGKLHDFLMNPKSRPDLQTPEGQAFLQTLEGHYWNDRTDPLTPWLAREWKKGRIVVDPHGAGPNIPRLRQRDPDYHQGLRSLSVPTVNHWADFYHSNHPLRRDLGDIMKHEVGPFSERVDDWDTAMMQEAHDQMLQGGEAVHTDPEGWTVRRLRTPEELKAEGEAMGHCVGGYHQAVADNRTQIYSLRDPQGSPHTTIEINPKVTAHGPWNGPNQGQVRQIQGKGNHEPNPEYKARVADWFRTFEPEQRPRWGDDESDGMYGSDGYWHERISHPDLIPEYEQEHGNLYATPIDTEDEYGLISRKHPMEADYDRLLENIKMHEYGSQGNAPDTDHMKDIYRLAETRGEIPKLQAAMEPWEQEQNEDLFNWMDQNYEYAPTYPDEPTGWEGSEDEYGELQNFDEETPGARPYWQIFPNPGDRYNEKYYDQAEAQKAYDWEYQNNWEGQHAGTQAVNYLWNLINQGQQQQTTAKTASKPPDHKNPWGDPCSCPWFKAIHKEHVGTVHEAAKIDWLRERPDIQADPTKRAIVNHILPQYDHVHDPLFPWIMREYNKGNVFLHRNIEQNIQNLVEAEKQYNDFIGAGFDPYSQTGQQLQDKVHNIKSGIDNIAQRGYGLSTSTGDPDPEWGDLTHLVGDFLPHFTDMMQTLKRRRQGINIDQHSFPEMISKWNQFSKAEQERKEEERRLNNGQVVHRFTDPEHKGWTVRRLTNRDECSLEGELMGHCVGSYGREAENGGTNIYSLRDHKNQPHATMEIKPPDGNPEDPTEWRIPEHAWDELPMEQFKGVPIKDIEAHHDTGGIVPYEVYSEFMKRAKEHGTAMPPVVGQITQTQGKSNSTPIEEYSDMLDQFLAPHDLQSYKPWWDEYYEREGPQNFRELVGHNGNDGFNLGGYPADDWYDGEPEEYRHAEGEAQERGIDGPELRIGMPNYDGILDSLVDPPAEYKYDHQQGKYVDTKPWRGYNPEAGDYVLKHALGQDKWERENPDRADRYDGWANHLEELTRALKDVDIPHHTPFEPPRELMEIPDYYERQKALKEAEKAHYYDQGISDDPMVHMYNHLGSQILPNFQSIGNWEPPSGIHPEQTELFKSPHPDTSSEPYAYPDYTQEPYMHPWAGHPDAGIYNPAVPIDLRYTKTANAIYQRWVFSPGTGEVTLSDNSGDPFEVKYHTDLAREMNEPNLVHGYAYRLGDGWRLTDWNSQPVQDPYIIASVMGKLRSENQQNSATWEPDYDEDWTRLHLGIPS